MYGECTDSSTLSCVVSLDKWTNVKIQLMSRRPVPSLTLSALLRAQRREERGWKTEGVSLTTNNTASLQRPWQLSTGARLSELSTALAQFLRATSLHVAQLRTQDQLPLRTTWQKMPKSPSVKKPSQST